MYVTPLCYGVTAVSYRFKKEGEYFYDFDAYNMVKWLTLKRIQWVKPLSQVSGSTENIFIKKVMAWHVTAWQRFFISALPNRGKII